ncbi:hypothetical protein X770_24730 [Mesorhizobium sp. LSJC269B00]|nr:hypothetical protein X770_24730 [Mesorhizobium sp. LSJC269B00]
MCLPANPNNEKAGKPIQTGGYHASGAMSH